MINNLNRKREPGDSADHQKRPTKNTNASRPGQRQRQNDTNRATGTEAEAESRERERERDRERETERERERDHLTPPGISMPTLACLCVREMGRPERE